MASQPLDLQHAALWLIGPDMPGLLNLASRFVAERGGSIEKDIACKFGEGAVIFMSLVGSGEAITRLERDRDELKSASQCGVVFQRVAQPQIPEGFQPELYGFDIITDDAPGLAVALTGLIESFGCVLVAHTGEQRVVTGPRPLVQAGQRFILLQPLSFDAAGFRKALEELVSRYEGFVVSGLQPVHGLLWWWQET